MARRSTFRSSCTGCTSGCGECRGAGGTSGPIEISDVTNLQDALDQKIDVNRALRVPVGETINEFPNAAGRANSLAGFGPSGQATVYTIGEDGFLAGAQGPRGPVGPGIQVGYCSPWFSNTLPPRHLWLNGGEFLVADYPELAAHLGNVGGASSSPEYCRLPDVRGRVIMGRETMGGTGFVGRVLQAICGLASHILGAAGGDQRAQKHEHALIDNGHGHGTTITDAGHDHNVPSVVLAGEGIGFKGGVDLASGWGDRRSSPSGSNINVTVNPSGSNIQIQEALAGNTQNIQPSLVANWIIYAGEADGEEPGGPVIVEINDVTGLEERLKIYSTSGYVPGLVADTTDPIVFSIPITDKNQFTLKAGAPGCAAKAESGATGVTVLRIEDGTSLVGTITWGATDTNGVWSVTTDAAFTTGKKLILRRTLPWDDSLDRIGFTIAGERIF